MYKQQGDTDGIRKYEERVRAAKLRLFDLENRRKRAAAAAYPYGAPGPNPIGEVPLTYRGMGTVAAPTPTAPQKGTTPLDWKPPDDALTFVTETADKQRKSKADLVFSTQILDDDVYYKIPKWLLTSVDRATFVRRWNILLSQTGSGKVQPVEVKQVRVTSDLVKDRWDWDSQIQAYGKDALIGMLDWQKYLILAIFGLLAVSGLFTWIFVNDGDQWLGSIAAIAQLLGTALLVVLVMFNHVQPNTTKDTGMMVLKIMAGMILVLIFAGMGVMMHSKDAAGVLLAIGWSFLLACTLILVGMRLRNKLGVLNIEKFVYEVDRGMVDRLSAGGGPDRPDAAGGGGGSPTEAARSLGRGVAAPVTDGEPGWNSGGGVRWGV